MSQITYDYEKILERLSALFPASQVRSFPMQTSNKKNKEGVFVGKPAFYIDARAVHQRLNDTCLWEVIYQDDPRNGEDGLTSEGKKSILCGIRILIERPDGLLEWVTRWDGADNSDIEGTKGGLSNATRRAAVTWGVGAYLYDVEAKWQPMKEPLPGKKPAYFVTAPRIPNEFLPKGEGTRARAAKPAATKPAPTAGKAEAKEDAPTGIKLSAAQTKKISDASKGKDRNAVKPIYAAVIAGELKVAQAVEKILALPNETK